MENIKPRNKATGMYCWQSLRVSMTPLPRVVNQILVTVSLSQFSLLVAKVCFSFCSVMDWKFWDLILVRNDPLILPEALS